ncbi:MAG: hypothetical protein WCS99_21395, partial [Limisphaerales bacterium]
DLVQDDVARRVKGLRMDDVLPSSLVAAWTRGALICVAVVAVLLAEPTLEFPRQLARALVPMAGIERVSRTKIRVVEPAETTRWLARGDHQPVVVELAGADADRAELEVLAADGPAERVLMAPGSGRQFAATVPVGQGSFAFRVRAGDATTKTVTIPTRARPAVMAFVKTYEAPAYAQLPARQVEEDHGHLSALEGTVADLRMRVNQAVRAGELAVVTDGKTNLVALSAPGPNVLHARVLMHGTATYQVRLVAAETRLGNKFSPVFEIRAEPDLAPHVTLLQPGTNLVVALDEVVTVQGVAGDDIGLASVAQQFQVNTGPWVEVPLALAGRTNSVLTRRWDLLPLGLAAGDHVVTRLVAVDLKGTRVESGTVTLTAGAPKSEPERSATLAAQREAQETLESAGRMAAELRKEFSPEQVAKIRAGDEVQRQQTVAGAGSTLAGVSALMDRAAQQLGTAMEKADPGRAAVDLALLNKAVDTARRDLLPKAQMERERLGKATAGTDPAAVSDAQKASLRVAENTAQLALQARELTASAQADAAARRLDDLAREQRRQAESATNATGAPAGGMESARQMAAASQEAARAAQELAELTPQVPKPAAARLAKAQENLSAARTAADRSGADQRQTRGQGGESSQAAGKEASAKSASSSGQPAGGSQGDGGSDKSAGASPGGESPAARQFRIGVEQAANTVRGVGREQAQRADKARGELARMVGGGTEQAAGLRRDLDRLAQGERRLSGVRAGGGDDPALNAKNLALAADLMSRLAPPSGATGPTSGTSSMSGTGGAGQAGGGAGGVGGAASARALPELGELRDANWARLPPKLAQDLREAQQNGVSGDYRASVEAYFKALAEKARK